MFEKIISKENIFVAWREFQQDKRWKIDVLEFGQHVEEHLLRLHRELIVGTYCHSQYTHFLVHDPKLRHVHKASVRDRVLHHAVHRILYSVFDRSFIFDLYSSRAGKGTHAAVERFEKLAWKLSRNRTRTVWVLQCDVRKYFDSVSHDILLALLRKKVVDEKLLALLETIIRSYEKENGFGILLGNLTSQLFANIYLDPLDQYVKRALRAPVYIRYADDILLAHTDREILEQWFEDIRMFIKEKLKLPLHPYKTTLRKWHQGIDFLGYVSFPTHRIVRTRTKRRVLKKINPENAASYFGVTRHARAYGTERRMRDILKVNISRKSRRYLL